MNADAATMIDARTALKRLLKDYSAEVTTPDRKSLDAAADLMRPGSRVYIASLPTDTPDKQIAAAAHVRKSGLEPVPHVVARNIESMASLDNLLARLSGEAGVDRALVLGGDRDKPAGALTESLQIIQSGYLQKYGINKIAIGCYPEGHPRISEKALDDARAAKLAAAEAAGLEIILVSQFCFDAKPIIAFAERIRAQGVKARFRVGVAGPAKHSTLLKYAMICGVGPSLRALKERQNLAKNMMSGETPEAVLTQVGLAQAANPALDIWGVHFFTFAALAKSIDWAEGILKGD